MFKTREIIVLALRTKSPVLYSTLHNAKAPKNRKGGDGTHSPHQITRPNSRVYPERLKFPGVTPDVVAPLALAGPATRTAMRVSISRRYRRRVRTGRNISMPTLVCVCLFACVCVCVYLGRCTLGARCAAFRSRGRRGVDLCSVLVRRGWINWHRRPLCWRDWFALGIRRWCWMIALFSEWLHEDIFGFSRFWYLAKWEF